MVAPAPSMHHVNIADQLPACCLVAPGLQACVRQVHTCMPCTLPCWCRQSTKTVHEDDVWHLQSALAGGIDRRPFCAADTM